MQAEVNTVYREPEAMPPALTPVLEELFAKERDGLHALFNPGAKTRD